MFPHLPRLTVLGEVRDAYNQWKTDQERLGGLMPLGIAGFVLGVSRQRIYQMLDAGLLRYVTHDGHRYVSGDDIKERLRAKRDGTIATGRPKKVLTKR